MNEKTMNIHADKYCLFTQAYSNKQPTTSTLKNKEKEVKINFETGGRIWRRWRVDLIFEFCDKNIC